MIISEESANSNSAPAGRSLIGAFWTQNEKGAWVTASAAAIEGGRVSLRLNGSAGLDRGFESLPADVLSRITFLDLRGLVISPELLRWAARLPVLDTLVLAGAVFEDEALNALAKAQTLRAIDLSNSAVTTEGLSWLRTHGNLRSFIASNTRLEDSSATLIATLSKLETLHLRRTRMTEESAAGLASIGSLREFQPPDRFDDAALKLFANHRKLSALWLSHTVITDRCFDPFGENDTLSLLTLPESFGDEGCETLPRFRNLRSIWMEYAGLTPRGIEPLLRIPGLDTWFFSAVQDPEALKMLASSGKLRRLCLFATVTARYDLEVLSGARSLEELRLGLAGLDDEETWRFRAMSVLKRLHFFRSDFSAAAIAQLKRDLALCVVTHAARPFCIPGSLRHGEVFRRASTPDGSAPWVPHRGPAEGDAIRADDELAFRDAGTTNLEGFAALVEESGNLFVEVKLEACALDADALAALGNMKFLKSLELTKCTFLAPIAPLLKKIPLLQKLELDFTTTGDEDVTHIVECAGLVDLSLRETDLSDEGLAQLGKLPRLRHLRVNASRVTPVGIEEFRARFPNIEVEFQPSASRRGPQNFVRM